MAIACAAVVVPTRAEPPLTEPSAVADRESRPIGRPSGKPELSSLAASPAKTTSLIENPLVRTGGSLGLVLALIYGLAKVAQRYTTRGGALAGALGGGPSPAGVIEILGRYPIGRGQTLLLMRVDNRVLLLAQTTPGFRIRGGNGGGASLTTLCEMTDAEDVASVLLKVQNTEQAASADRFRDLLGRADAKHESTGVIDVSVKGRRSRATAAGDLAELWDSSGATLAAPAAPLRQRLQAIRAGGAK